MRWFYELFFPVLWLAFILYWQVASVRVKATTRLEPSSSRMVRSVLFLAAIALFTVPLPIPVLYRHFLPRSNAAYFAGAAITVAGLAFCVWARLHLGSNWSRSVTLKQNHELITSGPYALVRHPIYTGLLTGFIGSAIATTQLRGILAFVLVLIPLIAKLRLEEKWMREQFGAAYDAYSRRVSALVPWLV